MELDYPELRIWDDIRTPKKIRSGSDPQKLRINTFENKKVKCSKNSIVIMVGSELFKCRIRSKSRIRNQISEIIDNMDLDEIVSQLKEFKLDATAKY